MTTFLMFGKYSAEAMKGISAARTLEAQNLIKKNGGEMVSAYVLYLQIDNGFRVGKVFRPRGQEKKDYFGLQLS